MTPKGDVGVYGGGVWLGFGERGAVTRTIHR